MLSSIFVMVQLSVADVAEDMFFVGGDSSGKCDVVFSWRRHQPRSRLYKNAFPTIDHLHYDALFHHPRYHHLSQLTLTWAYHSITEQKKQT